MNEWKHMILFVNCIIIFLCWLKSFLSKISILDLSAQSRVHTKHPSLPAIKRRNTRNYDEQQSVPELPILTAKGNAVCLTNLHLSQSSTTKSIKKTTPISLGVRQERRIVTLPRLHSKPNSLVWIVSFDQDKVKVSPTKVQTVSDMSEITKLFLESKSTGKLIQLTNNIICFHSFIV